MDLYVLGDSDYPSSPWLMKPYPGGTRDPRNIVFNKNLSFGGVKVESAFVVLKIRCRILSRSSSRYYCFIAIVIINIIIIIIIIIIIFLFIHFYQWVRTVPSCTNLVK